MKKALIAMSGGVDSSVAAAKMVEAGYDCLGVTMRLHDCGASCGAATEAADAAAVAEGLGFPFAVLDYRANFERQVMDHFVTAYEAGGKHYNKDQREETTGCLCEWVCKPAL